MADHWLLSSDVIRYSGDEILSFSTMNSADETFSSVTRRHAGEGLQSIGTVAWHSAEEQPPTGTRHSSAGILTSDSRHTAEVIFSSRIRLPA